MDARTTAMMATIRPVLLESLLVDVDELDVLPFSGN
jgi:hypothetical protein